MVIDNDSSALSLAVDAYGADRVKALAKTDQKAALKEVAQQFEALLMNSVLKSMRATTSQDGMFDNEQTRLYTSLLDQQLAQAMSKRGLGLAEILERQLSNLIDDPDTKPWQAVSDIHDLSATSWNPALAAESAVASAFDQRPTGGRWDQTSSDQIKSELARATQATAASASTHASSTSAAVVSAPPQGDPDAHVQRFIDRILPHARAAEKATGVPANFMVGHAALESGWGRYQIRHADGRSSHNLFGIKADTHWTGKVAEVVTTEYIGGLPLKRVEQFRAYESYEAAFRDYGDFLGGNPRYARALQATDNAQAFASELQSAGYATDPHYADKLTAVINGRSLRLGIAA